jgi:Zn-dependent metalloprotease/uncharacterized protein YjdB
VAKRTLSIFLALTSVVFSSRPIYAREVDTVIQVEKAKNNGMPNTLENLTNLSNGELKFQEKDGQVFLSGKLSQKGIAGSKAANEFLDANKQIFGIESSEDELQVVETKKDSSGDTFVKYNQVINGVTVEDKLLNVHFDKYGTIVSVNGKLEKNKSVTKLGNENISESDAINIAKKQFSYESLASDPKVTKTIFTKDDKNYEVFKVNIYYTNPTRGNWNVFVEVSSGNVINIENNIRYDGQVVGTGIDVSGNTKPLNLYQYGSSYLMRDLSNPATGYINTYSANNSTTYGDLVSNNTNMFNLENHKASVSAHYNAGKVIDFYKNLFNRNSLDNNNMPIISYTHYDNKYNNAFWDGQEMVYGDGDGTTFTYLSGDLDVVGHEMTHGVISYTANLNYENQSGALNESMADVFGVLIQSYSKYNVSSGGAWQFNSSDWVIGDEIYTPKIPGDALRSLSNPTLYMQPDNMSGYKYLQNNEAGDWGGIHINSGIPNKAAYLIAQSIGMDKIAKIYYRALVNYMTPTTDFQEARNLIAQSAADLYGHSGNEVRAINNAFYSVGIGPKVVNDTYEPNNNMIYGYSIDKGKAYQSYISSADDMDYYKLNVDSKGVLNVKLFNLPKDYNLKLFDSNGNELASSSQLGIAEESLFYNINNLGNYYIKVSSNSGYSESQAYSLSTQMLYGIGKLESPTTNASLNGAINLSGWHLDKTGVKKVEVLVDGNVIGQATYGDKRLDVSSIHPEYGNDNSGFHYTLDTRKISNGNHLINVEVTNTNGEIKTLGPINVSVSNIILAEGITLDKLQSDLKIGETVYIAATITPANVTNSGVIWSSSNTSIATVADSGKVTAVGVGTAVITATTGDGSKTASCTVNVTAPIVITPPIVDPIIVPPVTVPVVSIPSVSYQGHVQNIGWQDYVKDGALSGTEGKSLRVEGFRIKLENAPAGLKIKYKTHVQNIGWQDGVYDGAMAGTQGQSLRVEALQIMLEGIDADKYSVQYQAHVENEGWQQWVRDGQTSGSFGKSQRIEALKIKITEKMPSVAYQGHVQNIGWQDYVKDGVLAGTEGRSLRVEGFRIKLENAPAGLKIKYKTHVQNIGWQDWVFDGVMGGTQGQSLRVEALQIMLEGTDADKYSVEYQAHVENEGWQSWVKDGQTSGSFGKSQRIEALKIIITKK